jgi:hypothetical protein
MTRKAEGDHIIVLCPTMPGCSHGSLRQLSRLGDCALSIVTFWHQAGPVTQVASFPLDCDYATNDRSVRALRTSPVGGPRLDVDLAGHGGMPARGSRERLV